MKGVKVALPHPHLDLSAAQTAGEQVVDRDHAPLASRKPRDQHIGISGVFATCQVVK
jgi:hypothetical protein